MNLEHAPSTVEASTHEPRGSRIAVRPSLVLTAAIVVALVLRVHCLIFPYLWLDEYVTLWSISGASYGEMLDRALHWTASGPLFVLCYRASCDLVGNVDWGVKLPGVIGGTATVWVAWWLVRRLGRRMEIRADAVALEHQGEAGIYARALGRLYEQNQMPAVMPERRQVHPHLYDRLLAAGVTPDYPRPAAPDSISWNGVMVSVWFGILLVFSIPDLVRQLEGWAGNAF